MAPRARRWTTGLAFLASGLLLSVATQADADEIQLRRGGRISGVVVEKTERTITIETGPGRVTLPLSLVEKVVDSRSVIEVWQERSSTLAGSDLQGWVALARWAEAQSLVTQARAAWQRVLALEPGNAEANAALGRVQLDGTWVAREDAYRAQGLLPFEGRWVSRAEHDALLQEQAAESAAARSQREAEVRLREAEARAREAEARAQEVENAAAADTTGNYGGIPVWGFGVGFGGGGHRGHDNHGDRRGEHDRPRPEPRPTPVPPPPPSSMGPIPPQPAAHGQPAMDGSRRHESSMR